jgi:integrase
MRRKQLTSDKKAGDSAARLDGLQHTADHKNLVLRAKEAELELVNIDSDISRLPFSEAARRWQKLRRQVNAKESTNDEDECYIRALDKLFGPIRLCDVTAGYLKIYQDLRSTNPVIGTDANGNEMRRWPRTAGNSRINHELNCLAMIMQGKLKKGQAARHPKLWAKLKPFYFPLAQPKWSPAEILSEEDEEDFFSRGASHPEAQLAYWVACITNNTTATGIELRGLRLKNLFLRTGKELSEIYIPEDAVKNDSRPRKITLNRTARWAVEQCYKRALTLGATEPNHFLFPFRVHRGKWDPTRRASRWFVRNSWNKLRTATGQAAVTPHKFRHQCITRLLENSVHPETVRSIAGHVTEKMMEYYSHIRAQTKYDAVMAIELSEQKRRKQGPHALRRSA